jgi:hypothetical protein
MTTVVFDALVQPPREMPVNYMSSNCRAINIIIIWFHLAPSRNNYSRYRSKLSVECTVGSVYGEIWRQIQEENLETYFALYFLKQIFKNGIQRCKQLWLQINEISRCVKGSASSLSHQKQFKKISVL